MGNISEWFIKHAFRLTFFWGGGGSIESSQVSHSQAARVQLGGTEGMPPSQNTVKDQTSFEMYHKLRKRTTPLHVNGSIYILWNHLMCAYEFSGWGWGVQYVAVLISKRLGVLENSRAGTEPSFNVIYSSPQRVPFPSCFTYCRFFFFFLSFPFLALSNDPFLGHLSAIDFWGHWAISNVF